MRGLKAFGLVLAVLGLSLLMGPVASDTLAQGQGQKIVWVSTQLVPIQEAEFVRNEILKPFTEETGIEVEFIGAEYGELFTRLEGEAKAGQGSTDLVGGLQGDFVGVAGFMDDISDVLEALGDRTFSARDLSLGEFGRNQIFIPWMTATYLMVANKKALDYLPNRVDPNAITYGQLIAWATNLEKRLGEKKLGIPAGPRSLLHRFVHGYAYPSFTRSTVKQFISSGAVAMWRQIRDGLWPTVNPAVATADSADTLLLDETIWIAWDHVARLKQALVERPDDFIAFPAPAGPAGRGYIPVLAGLGIPKTAPNRDAAARLIEYLTRPQTQVKILQGVGFFPVVAEAADATPSGGLRILAEAVAAQSSMRDALPALIPGGLGERSGEFGKIYRDAFVRIVLQGEDIETVLREQGELLNALFQETGASCPLPDPPETPCTVEGL